MSNTIVNRLQRIEEKLDEALRQMECGSGGSYLTSMEGKHDAISWKESLRKIR